MDRFFVCPACREPHSEPADAAYVLEVLCLDCELGERYREEMTQITIVVKTAA